MRTKLIMLMLLAASSINAQNKLSIVVDGIDNVKGRLVVGVYDKDTYMKAAPIAGTIAKVDGETVTVEIENIPAGEYAVSLYHDENENNKLDVGAFGMPTEKFGNSNNAEGKMGPPSYDDCKFKVEEDMVIYITLKNVPGIG